MARLALRGAVPVPQRAACVPAPGQQLHSKDGGSQAQATLWSCAGHQYQGQHSLFAAHQLCQASVNQQAALPMCCPAQMAKGMAAVSRCARTAHPALSPNSSCNHTGTPQGLRTHTLNPRPTCPSASMARVLRLPPTSGEAVKSRPRSRVPSSDSITLGDSRSASVSTPCSAGASRH